MSRSVAPGGSGSPVSRSGRLLDVRGPTSLGYELADAFGFELVPSRVRQHLQSSALIGTDSLSASSDPPAVMKRADGTFYQSAAAWWGDEKRLLVFTYEREMERVGGKQFRPASTWSVNGSLSRLGPVGGPERSVWRFDASGAGEAARKTPTTDDPLDLLPPEVVGLIRGGDTDAWQLHRKEWASETVVGMHFTTGRALLLRAVREATSRKALSSADWHLETLDAPVVEKAPVLLACP